MLGELFLIACAQKDNNEEKAPKAPRGYRSETMLKLAYALKFIDLIETKPVVRENIKVYKDLIYKQVDSIDLKLDIYRSKKLKKATPALIFIHGGSWAKGKRSDYLPYLLAYS